MKIIIEFTLDETWDEYKNVNPELIVEDIFEFGLKDGITYKIKE